MDFARLRAVLAALRVICNTEYELHLFRVTFMTAFFDAYGLCELVTPARTAAGPACLHQRDVAMGEK